MGKFTAGVLLLVVVGRLLQQVIGENQCSTTGKNGTVPCVCNIMDACDGHGKAQANWDGFLPQNVEYLGLFEGQSRNLAYLCEGDAVAILYDCNSRIPLYAATKITGDQLSAKSEARPNIKFRQSDLRNQLSADFQQNDDDYENSNNRELCLKSSTKSSSDDEWLPPSKRARKTHPIDRGHVIASRYGFAVPERMAATFTYTNVVPQYGSFNRGAWRTSEGKLIEWGQVNCAAQGAQHVEMFIIVGTIPWTNRVEQKPCYLGKKGFSDKKDKNLYRVNVPSFMWTAACCKYNLNGTWKYNSTAFYGENNPENQPCKLMDVAALSEWLRSIGRLSQTLSLFPQTPQCKDLKNYIPLK